jgi:hypothetical protein
MKKNDSFVKKEKKKKEEEKAKRVVEASAHRLPPFYPLDVWA